MTACDRFDVLTAPFPFVDIPQRKPRPVLVLSSRDFNVSHRHLVTATITTAADSRWPSDVAITDLASAGLAHRSVVRAKIFTRPIDVIGRSIGRFSARDQGAFDAVFDTIFPLGGRSTSPRPVA